MAVERCATLLLALAVVAAASAEPPPATAGNATVTAVEANHHAEDADEGEGVDLESGLASAKTLLSMALGLLSATIQVKGFGLAVVNTLVNVGRFLVELHAARTRHPSTAPPLSYSHSTYF